MRGSAILNSKMMAVIIGPPGSGKGTVSSRIVKEFKLRHLSSGDILRNHINDKTDFGVKIEPIVNAGKLVPVNLLAPLMEHEVEKTQSGWLLDGYPRSVEQAESLVKRFPPNIAIHLNVPFDVIIERIKLRYVHIPSGRVYNLDFNPPKVTMKDDITGEPLIQRDDDKPEFVAKRLEIYSQQIKPVLEFFRARNVLKEFSGTETNVIWPHVQKFLQEFSSK